jgi:hypothetical protein
MKVEFRISEDSVTLLFKKVKGKLPLTETEANEVAIFLKAYYKQVIIKWETVFIYHKKVKCDVCYKQKAEQKSIAVLAGRYVHDFIIAITFSDGIGCKVTGLVDFLPLFHKYVKGDNLKYFTPGNFKKFIVKNGNIYWGKNEDVVFPVSLLLKAKKENDTTDEEILYVI